MINDIYAGRGTPPSTFIMGSYSDADDKDSVRSPNKHKEGGEKSRRGRLGVKEPMASGSKMGGELK